MRKRKSLIITIIILISIIALAGVIVYNLLPVTKIKKNLKQAYKYLEELDYDKAVFSLKNVLEINPQNEEAQSGLRSAYTQWIDSNLEAGDYSGALDIADDAYALLGDISFSNRKTGIYVLWLERYVKDNDYDGASRLLNRIYGTSGKLSLDNQMEEIYNSWAEKLVLDGQYQEAREVIEDAWNATGNEIKEVEKGSGWDQPTLSIRSCKKKIKSEILTSNYINEGVQTQCELFYDRNGMISTEIQNGVKVEYLYDVSGRVLAKLTYHLDGEPETCEAQIYHYEYDANEKVYRATITDEQSKLLNVIEFEYGLDTRKETTFDENGDIVLTREFNQENYLTYEHKLKPGSEVFIDTFYEYENGNKIVRAKEYEDGELRSTAQYEYDVQGRLIGWHTTIINGARVLNSDGSLKSTRDAENYVTIGYNEHDAIAQVRMYAVGEDGDHMYQEIIREYTYWD